MSPPTRRRTVECNTARVYRPAGGQSTIRCRFGLRAAARPYPEIARRTPPSWSWPSTGPSTGEPARLGPGTTSGTQGPADSGPASSLGAAIGDQQGLRRFRVRALHSYWRGSAAGCPHGPGERANRADTLCATRRGRSALMPTLGAPARRRRPVVENGPPHLAGSDSHLFRLAIDRNAEASPTPDDRAPSWRLPALSVRGSSPSGQEVDVLTSGARTAR